MGSVKVSIVRGNAAASGTQDFTISGFGTVKAAMFICVGADVEDTIHDHGACSIGFCDASSQVVAATQNEENASSANTSADHRGATDEVIMMLDPVDGVVDGEANWDSFITDGVRINWGVALPGGDDFLITCILFGGDDLSVDVGTFATGTTINVANNITGVGFEAHNVIVIGQNGDAFDDTARIHSAMSLGFVDNDEASTITHFCGASVSRDGRASGQVWGIPRNNRCYQTGLHNTDGGSCELSGFDGEGWDAVLRDTATGSPHTMGYLALRYGDSRGHAVFNFAAEVVTGTNSPTAPGFEPQAVILAVTEMVTINTRDSAESGGVLSFSAFDDTTQGSSSFMADDGDANARGQCHSEAVALHNRRGNQSTWDIRKRATFTSFDANGWTWNYTAANNTAGFMGGLAIDIDPSAGVETPGVLAVHSRRQALGPIRAM